MLTKRTLKKNKHAIFKVEFENQNKTVSLSQTILYDHGGVMYCSMTGLDLHDGHFEVRVSAINHAFLSSEPVSTNMSVSTIIPKVSGMLIASYYKCL